MNPETNYHFGDRHEDGSAPNQDGMSPSGERRSRFEQKKFARSLLQHSSYFVLAFQGALTVFSLLAAWVLRFDFDMPEKKLLLLAAPLLILLRLIAIRIFHLHHGWWRYTGIPDAINVIKAVAASTVVFWVISDKACAWVAGVQMPLFGTGL